MRYIGNEKDKCFYANSMNMLIYPTDESHKIGHSRSGDTLYCTGPLIYVEYLGYQKTNTNIYDFGFNVPLEYIMKYTDESDRHYGIYEVYMYGGPKNFVYASIKVVLDDDKRNEYISRLGIEYDNLHYIITSDGYISNIDNKYGAYIRHGEDSMTGLGVITITYPIAETKLTNELCNILEKNEIAYKKKILNNELPTQCQRIKIYKKDGNNYDKWPKVFDIMKQFGFIIKISDTK